MKNNSRIFAGILVAPVLATGLLLQIGLEKKSKALVQKSAQTLTEVQLPREVYYIWKLADQFEFSKNHIQRRPEPSRQVRMNFLGSPSKLVRDYQVSSDIEFKVDARFVPGSAQIPFFHELKIGDNYWRGFTRDQWEPTHQLRVTPTYLPVAPRLNQVIDQRAQGGTQASVGLQLESTYPWHLLEVSSSEDFARSKFYWFTGAKTQIPYAKADFYLRLQGVSNQQELSQASPIYRLHIGEPQAPAVLQPAAPKLSLNTL